MKKTNNKYLRLELDRGVENTDKIIQVLSKVIGTEARIMKFIDTATFEIKDINQEATEDKILQAVNERYGNSEEVHMLRWWTTTCGTQTAVVRVPIKETPNEQNRRIRIGYVNWRVKATKEAERCYKCQEFGHTRKTCEGSDKTLKSWKYGGDGHKSKGYQQELNFMICVNEVDSKHILGSLNVTLLDALLRHLKNDMFKIIQINLRCVQPAQDLVYTQQLKGRLMC